MLRAEEERLDAVFHALSNKTRRALLQSLARGPARVSTLAEPHKMSVAAVSKHLFVLERAGLITRTREGSVQSCVIDVSPLVPAEAWIAGYRDLWNDKLDRLAAYVEKKPKR